MKHFKALFGVESSEIKKTCIVMPLMQKDALHGFGIKKFARGKLYGAGCNKDFSVISTGVICALNGDAVLYLKETPCKNVILFGSCGLVSSKKGLSIGSLVSPSRVYANESFSRMLLEMSIEEKIFYPDQGVLENLLKIGTKQPVKEVACATIASLKLEEDLSDLFIGKDIDVVDMECSAFFAAAHYCGFKPVALFYVSDIIKEKPFYIDFDLSLKSTLSSAAKNAADILCAFIRTNLNA